MMGVVAELRVGLDLPSSFIAVETRKLDVHENEIGPLGKGFRHSVPAIGGLRNIVTRSGKKIAQNTPQVFLVFHDKNALGHAVTLRISARIGSSI